MEKFFQMMNLSLLLAATSPKITLESFLTVRWSCVRINFTLILAKAEINIILVGIESFVKSYSSGLHIKEIVYR